MPIEPCDHAYDQRYRSVYAQGVVRWTADAAAIETVQAQSEGYFEGFRHGMLRMAGMGMGLERLTRQLLGRAKEASPFPRDRRRLTP